MVLKGSVSDVKGKALSPLALTLNNTKVLNEITSMLQNYGDLRYEFEEVVRSLLKYNQRQFNLKGNGKYAPLSESYKKWKKKHFPGQPIMVLTGRLRNSITNAGDSIAGNNDRVVEINKTSMNFGTKVPYSGFLQYGTKKMPARPILFWDDGRIRVVERIIYEGSLRRIKDV